MVNLLSKTRYVLSLLSPAILLGFLACTPKEEVKQTSCSFDQATMLESYYTTSVSPALNNLVSAAEDLNTKIQTTDINLSNIGEFRGLYQQLLSAYQGWQVFKFHPSSANGTLYNRLSIFPTDTAATANNISNKETAVSTLVKDQVGLPALEFLLYGNGTLSDESIVNRHLAGDQAFLRALSANINTIIASIKTDWDGYSTTFTSTTGSADGSPLALFANSFVQDFEYLKNIKMKIPAGRYDRLLKPHFAEAYYSNTSIEYMLLHLDRIISIFNNYDSVGLDDYCKCLSANRSSDVSLETDILQGLILANNTLESLRGKTMDEVLGDPNNLDVFNTAIDQLQALTPFLKSEMIPYMGVKINYPDNDGD